MLTFLCTCSCVLLLASCFSSKGDIEALASHFTKNKDEFEQLRLNFLESTYMEIYNGYLAGVARSTTESSQVREIDSSDLAKEFRIMLDATGVYGMIKRGRSIEFQFAPLRRGQRTYLRSIWYEASRSDVNMCTRVLLRDKEGRCVTPLVEQWWLDVIWYTN